MSKPRLEPIEPTSQDMRRAAKAYQLLSDGQIDVDELPEMVLTMIALILKETAQGHALTIAAVESDMTTTEAADYLNVSRPYLVKLLDEGKLAFHYVGVHRRIDSKDVKAYKEQQKKRSYEAMARLQKEAQELNMGY